MKSKGKKKKKKSKKKKKLGTGGAAIDQDLNSEDGSQFKSVNGVGLESEYELDDMLNYDKDYPIDDPYGEEEEKAPNISKTRINDASAVHLNSNYDQGSLDMEDGNSYTDIDKNMGEQLKNAGIDE